MYTEAMSASQQFALFVLLGLGTVVCLADYITTVKGFEAGFVEANPVKRFLIKKLGHPLAWFLGTGFFMVATMALSKFSAAGSILVAAIVVGGETRQAIVNYKKVKANKK